MNKENIKIGDVWIEDSKSIRKRYFLLASIFISILLLSTINECLLAITILIYTVIFFYMVISNNIPPSLDPTMIVVHYRTNVYFSENISLYPKIFDLMKECYENEDLNQKSQKYKIKDIIFLYNSDAEKAKEWFEEQNKIIKI